MATSADAVRIAALGFLFPDGVAATRRRDIGDMVRTVTRKLTADKPTDGTSVFSIDRAQVETTPNTNTTPVAEATTTITNATLAATLKIRSMPLSKDIATALGIPSIREIPIINPAYVFPPKNGLPGKFKEMISISRYWAIKATEQYADARAMYYDETPTVRHCMLHARSLHFFPLPGDTPLLILSDFNDGKWHANEMTRAAKIHKGGMSTPVFANNMMRVTAPVESAYKIRAVVEHFADNMKNEQGHPMVSMQELKRSNRDPSVAFEVTAVDEAMVVFEVLRQIAFVTHHAPLLTSRFSTLQATFRLNANTAEAQSRYQNAVEDFVAFAYAHGADASLRDRQLRVTVPQRSHLVSFAGLAEVHNIKIFYDVPGHFYGDGPAPKTAIPAEQKAMYAIKALGPQSIHQYRAVAESLGLRLDEETATARCVHIAAVPENFTVPLIDQAKFPGFAIDLLHTPTAATAAKVTPIPAPPPRTWKAANAPKTPFNPDDAAAPVPAAGAAAAAPAQEQQQQPVATGAGAEHDAATNNQPKVAKKGAAAAAVAAAAPAAPQAPEAAAAAASPVAAAFTQHGDSAAAAPPRH
jgi:hypothetical protein